MGHRLPCALIAVICGTIILLIHAQQVAGDIETVFFDSFTHPSTSKIIAASGAIWAHQVKIDNPYSLSIDGDWDSLPPLVSANIAIFKLEDWSWGFNVTIDPKTHKSIGSIKISEQVPLDCVITLEFERPGELNADDCAEYPRFKRLTLSFDSELSTIHGLLTFPVGPMQQSPNIPFRLRLLHPLSQSPQLVGLRLPIWARKSTILA